MKVNIETKTSKDYSIAEALLKYLDLNDFQAILRVLDTQGITESDVSGKPFHDGSSRDHFVHHVLKSGMDAADQIDLIEYMYAFGLLPLNRVSTQNCSPTIFYAVESENTSVVKFMLDSGERILTPEGKMVIREDKSGLFTSVLYFAESRHTDLLLEYLFPNKIHDDRIIRFYYIHRGIQRISYMTPFVDKYLAENEHLTETHSETIVKTRVTFGRGSDTVIIKKTRVVVKGDLIAEKKALLDEIADLTPKDDYVSHAYFTHCTQK